ncbi:carbohydrate ABC transporter permease [Falsihalocynthiibacter arcticus]|uniref:ABC transporter permease n=1 Tax=Falsihalocynthiibacter arcticus TaxID=1579316 RepID=A0A126V0Z1_9RHOB|nr:sugar ABC transporter permease [Falsihalocynthiibacter arcticus]AML51817.1 ABC transporter permease [Falsihalocynthiibacter arcticus]
MAVLGTSPRDIPRRRARSQRGTAWLLIAPALTLMVLILLVPILSALVLSFTDYSLAAPEVKWVGFDNYEKIFTRSSYEKMLWATFTYVVVVVPISVGLGLGAALLINSLARGKEIYKTIYFLPVMATLLAMAIVWELMLHPTIGTVNRTLQMGCGTVIERLWPWLGDGCANGMPLWLGDKDYALWVICFLGIWQGFGFNMVLYLAGLTGVPRDLYNAAEMDGARSGWERFRLVTWPALGPTTVFVVTITCIRAFQVFDTVEALFPQGGGPSKSAYMMMYAIYEKGIKQNLIGIGSAITMLFLIFVMIITIIQRRLTERKVHYS